MKYLRILELALEQAVTEWSKEYTELIKLQNIGATWTECKAQEEKLWAVVEELVQLIDNEKEAETDLT